MRKIAHLSDIHFGSVDPSIIEPLISTLNDLKPDLVAVSGDLTQRARSSEFIDARAFLDRLPTPQIIVPGNHDVPLYNVFRRFAAPLRKYRRYIDDDLQPFFSDDKMAVIGINTARSSTFKGGRINTEQIESIRNRLCNIDSQIIKVIVTHHPFDLPEGNLESDIVGRAPLAMKMLATCGADIFLAGHMHTIHTGHTATRYKIEGHSALVVQAGTATSTRHRGETNSFNLIHIDGAKIRVDRLVWQPEKLKFAGGASEGFYRDGAIWRPDEAGNVLMV